MSLDFVYTPLKSSRDIRIFSFASSGYKFSPFSRFRPSSRSPIKGNLHRECLDDPHRQPYVALSYTWGSPVSLEPVPKSGASKALQQNIKCGGKVLEAGENLHDALSVLRELKPSIPVWIDALSINQKDGKERSAQVSMMGEIYSRAAAVYVWLGPHDNSSKIAVHVIEKLSEAFSSLPSYQRPRGVFKFNDPVLYKLIGISQITIDEWQAIVDLFSRTWFHRVWIAQEAALSADLLFLCGDSKISEQKMTGFAKWICQLQWNKQLYQLRKDKETHPMGGIDALYHIAQLKSRMQQQPLQDPETRRDLSLLFGVSTEKELYYAYVGFILLENRHRLATEQVDKVFAPLALAKMIAKDHQLHASLPFPDYTKKVEEVYTQISTAIIVKIVNLSFLSFVERRGTYPHGLPSWVPDFSAATYSKPLSQLNHNATAAWNVSTSPIIQNNLLKVHGIIFDTISDSTTTHSDPYAGLLPLLLFLSHPPNHNVRLETLLRTLVQNHFEAHWEPRPTSQRHHNPIPFQTVAKSFKQWIKIRIALHALHTRSYATRSFTIPPTVLETCGTSSLFPTTAELQSFVPRFLKYMHPGPSHDIYISEMLEPQQLFESMIAGYADHRCLFRSSKKGVLGLGPVVSREGDEIWFLRGARVPFLLRRVGNGCHELVGEAYVHEYMQGEAFGMDTVVGNGSVVEVTLQ